jgi:hypothetical protein
MGELTGAANFWAMHSCEYSQVTKAKQWQMKQRCLQNIAFIQQGITLQHDLIEFHLADCVSITFKRQKNDRKWARVTWWRTLDKFLCPVKLCASIV